uniref:Uncharacterized protein n=1 Tax=Mandrillus leucophaeus TaxID=9568 RepID=A0A2K6AH81_MANLE
MPNFAKSLFIHPSCSVSQTGVQCEPRVWCTPVWVTRVKLHLKKIYISTTN